MAKIQANFKVSGKIVRLLGRESISDKMVALIELIKNSYDADATAVKVEIDREKGTIRIEDDGIGMSQEDIIKKWLIVGTDSKEVLPVSSKYERQKIGAKGIGRFASERLGTSLLLATKIYNSREVSNFTIDWQEIERNEKYFTDYPIEVNIEESGLVEKSGTSILISNLRDIWDEYDIANLEREIIGLVPPHYLLDKDKIFGDFKVSLIVDGKSRNTDSLAESILSSYDLRLDAYLDGESGMIRYSIQKSSDGRTWEDVFLLHNDKGKTECGSVRLKLLFFFRDKQGRPDNKRETTNKLLDSYGGIRIYRDTLRVKPFGDIGNDWIRQDAKRLYNFYYPGKRQTFGIVEISKNGNHGLVDVTNREGFVHNRAYEELVSFVHKSLTKLETIREKMDKEKREEQDFIEVKEAIVKKVDDPRTRNALLLTLDKDKKKFEAKKKNELITAEKIYRAFATLGSTAAYTTHELSHLALNGTAIIRQMKRDGITPEKRAELLDAMNLVWKRIVSMNKFMKEVINVESREKVGVNIANLIGKTVDIFKVAFPVEDSSFIEISFVDDCIAPPVIDAFPVDVDTIVINLMTNAIDAVKGVTKPWIKVHLTDDEKFFYIRMSDNGYGIAPENMSSIFEDGVSYKENGNRTGYGMGIMRAVANEYGGDVMIERSEKNKGTTVLVTMKKGK